MKTKLVTDKETGNIWINTVQDVEPILRRNHELSTVLPVSYTHLTLPTIYSV